MSYRVDIPTLSANEVYTLTFEYEGTETIQLVVGDLTLETTDRRVVFTTTSPVNYIESNVNLTNLNIYEGYYESDDFGGEYTQESYIEGKSLVNLIQSQKHLEFQNRDCGVETFEDNMIKLTITDPSSLTSTWQHGWIKTSANLKVGATYTCVIHVVENSISTEGITVGASYGTLVHGNASNSLGSGQTGIIVFTYTTAAATLKDYNGYYDGFCQVNHVGDWQNGSLKYGVMVFEGDYYDYFINNNIPYFEGIGCVKSPKIVSYPKYPNIAPNCKRNLSNNSSKVYRSDDNSYIKITNTARWTGVHFGFFPQDFGYALGDTFCLEFDVIDFKGTGAISNATAVQVGVGWGEFLNSNTNTGSHYINEIGHYKLYFKSTGNADNGRICSISVYLNTGTGGINTVIEIDNLKIYKIDSINDINVYEYEDCKVSTPDDLELYAIKKGQGDVYSTGDTIDTLDLTTGIVTKRLRKSYHDTFDGRMCGEYYYVPVGSDDLGGKYHHCLTNREMTQVGYNAALPQDGKVYYYTYLQMFLIGCSTWTSVDDAQAWLDSGNGLYLLYPTPSEKTIQLDINALKSYRNGSIQTSSQQLAPTLKTTLPVSNKFTTTNLTSGATYNIYFDGTATKLDAGGTIITDPVSPCEVECGGTTLTIEGTDIQNIRVLETTNKNEVGSVNGTTDVELSGVECVQGGIPNLLSTLSTDWENGTDYSVCIRYKYGIDVQPNEKYVFTVSNTRGLTYKEIAIWNTDKWVSNAESIITTQRLTANTPYILTVPSGVTKVYIYFPYDSSGNLNQAHEYELRMQKGTVDLGYGGQKEATIPLVCNLEQPIKLRSLGTTYDSYNPVTGELVKRIGVSETDGSYSVLSSPIVGKLEKSCSFMGNLATSDQLLVYNGATKNGDVITLNKVNKWSLVQLVGSCTRMEKGKQYMCILHDIVGDMTGVVFVRQQDTSIDILPIENNRVIFTAMSNASNRWCFIQQNEGIPNGGTVSFKVSIIEYFEGAEKLDIPYFNTYEQRDLTLQLLPPTCPQLYTNGQVKVYSESEVYPTTILNGQSTNNYEVNELNTSNNYTIRYDGECESINLANKSNEQGTNRIVKSGTDGRGNLTFVNNSEDIDNVLLVQNDVREQEINHFNGLQTVEVNQLFISNKQNLFEQYMKADYDYITDLRWGTQQYSSLHNGVFKCGELVGGENLQMAWNLIKPHADNVYGSKLKEDNPIVLANKVYNISFNISIVDHHTVNRNHNYTIRAFDFDGNEVSVQKATGGQTSLSTWSNGVTNPTPKGHINQNVIFSKDVYCFTLHADYGGSWAFDCTITDFTICEPEYAKPDVPLVYEYIDLPQPVQLNSLPDGTCDTYNLITGEYVQNVGYAVYDDTTTWNSYAKDFYYTPCPSDFDFYSSFIVYHRKLESTVASKLWAGNSGYAISSSVMMRVIGLQSKEEFLEYVNQYPMKVVYKRTEPITTQLTPVNIPTFDGGILQLITTDGKVFPMVEYSMPTNNRYDTSSWEAGAVYTQRNMTEVYFNESTTPMTPTETMTLTTDHISSGSIILNDNGNGLIVLNGDYTGRDIPYFTGMRSVEAIEVETTPSPDQPLFGKGGRK